MKFVTFSVFLLVVLQVVLVKIAKCARTAHTNRGCTLTIPDDIPRNEPIYLVQHESNFTIFEPKGQVNYLSFSLNEKMQFFCPGKKNSIQIERESINSNLTEISCENGKFMTNGFGEAFNLNGINCTKGVQADVVMKKQKCSTTGSNIFNVGFKLNNKVLLQVFQICFDNTSWTPVWSKHVINGKSIKFNVKENGRPQFKTTGLPSSARPSDAYKKTSQINHFTDLIGTTQTQTYFTSTSYLARGHITPDADFIFPSAQWSTYFYINTCPQFQSVNAGNWLRVESLARKLAQHYDVDMTIFTGVYETMQLEDSNGNLKKLYLTADEKYEVPKWLWKIIKNTATNSAIVMITLNDPFKSIDDVEEFCPNVCARAFVDSKHFKTMKKGYTFCCELLEFRRVVRTLPPDATAGKLLSCSNIILDD